MNLRGYLIGDDKTFVFSSLETRKAGGDLIVVFNINFDNIKSGNGWSATIAGYFTEKGVFIARQHTNPRYWYNKSVPLSVCPSVTFRYQMKTA